MLEEMINKEEVLDAEWETECQEILDKERYAEFKATLRPEELKDYNFLFDEI
jgi:hypothetical protein